MSRLLLMVFALLLFVVGNAYAVSLAWDANTESDLLGYNVYWCNPPVTSLCDAISINGTQDVGNQTTIQLTPNFEVGTVFFVTAYDTSQNESGPSNRVQLAQLPPPPPPPPPADETPPNFKVAFIGDSGDGSGQQAVLNLINGENVDLVLHQGDFSYSSGPTTSWKNAINNTLGSNFPYLGSDGNHDSWSQYEPFFEARLASMGLASTLNGPNYTRTYRGLKMVFSQEGGNPTHIRNALAGDTHIWKICSWHKNRVRLQVGGKGNAQSLGDYEECRKAGALIMTGHEHSYHRTKTLSAISDAKLTVDPTCSDPNSLCVDPGRTFVVVSGLGGVGIRNQDRCLPKTAPYGCDGEWAIIYTSDQGAKFGALFMVFHIDGDPRKARGYFKNTSGQVIDEFMVQVGAIVSPPPPPPPGGPPFAQMYEAEIGTLVSPMTKGSDPNALSGQYISPTSGTSSSSPLIEATLAFAVPQSDIYYLWVRIFGPDQNSDALYVGIDGSWDRVFPVNVNTYEWIRVESSSNVLDFPLSAGGHTFQIGHGEINARADALFVTNDATEVPTFSPSPMDLPVAPSGLIVDIVVQ